MKTTSKAKSIHPLLIATFVVPLLLSSFAQTIGSAQQPNTVRASHHGDWQYGLSMTPTTSGTYDAIEMPTNGTTWTTAPTKGALAWFVSSTTAPCGPFCDTTFAQIGIIFNGGDTAIQLGDKTTQVPAHSWGVFYEYFDDSLNDHGNAFVPPSSWHSGDQIYFSIAAYPSKQEISFQWKDTIANGVINKKTCTDGFFGAKFTGNVGGLSESSDSNLVPGDIHVNQIALWDENISTGNRNSGSTSAYAVSSPPTTDHIYVIANNDVTLGFQSSGTHPSGGTSLWTQTFTGSNEYVPPDLC